MESRYWLELNGDLWMIWVAYWIFAAIRTLKTKERESYLQRLFHLALLGVATSLLFFLEHWPEPFSRGTFDFPARGQTGCVLTAIGLCYAVWARVHLGKYWSGTITIKEGHQIIRSGPYAITRHPIYTGIIFAFLGTAITSGHIAGVVGFLLIPIAFLMKIRAEERVLISRFGKDYEDYRREVKGLIPGLL